MNAPLTLVTTPTGAPEVTMQTVHIALCDDEPAHLDVLERAIRTCAFWRGSTLKLSKYTGGSDLLDAFQGGVGFDYIFLDIDMPDIDGIEVCERIAASAVIPVIFVSSFIERMPDVYRLYPAIFIPKLSLNKVLDDSLREITAKLRARGWFEYSVDGAKRRTLCADICYIESYMRSIRLVTRRGDVFPDSTALESARTRLVSFGFFKAHRSFLINLQYYQSHTFKEATLYFNRKTYRLPITRGIGDALAKAYFQHMMNVTPDSETYDA